MSLFDLGIDVAKAKLDCALRFPDGKFKSKVVENSPTGFKTLVEWLAKYGATSAHICMEATGVYWEAVAEYLAADSMTVSVVNPAQIKAFGQSQLVRTKTDQVDARLIARFWAERNPAPWQAPSINEQALRAMVLRLDSLQVMRTQENNRFEVSRDVVKPSIAAHIK
jgi:transposase